MKGNSSKIIDINSLDKFGSVLGCATVGFCFNLLEGESWFWILSYNYLGSVDLGTLISGVLGISCSLKLYLWSEESEDCLILKIKLNILFF